MQMEAWFGARAASWRGKGVLLVLGAMTALALPPFYFWPVLPATIGALLFTTLGAERPRHAFWGGWWWGAGFFLAGLYWVSHALLTDAARFGWLIPFALTLIPGTLALLVALPCWLTRKIGLKGLAGALLFSIMLVAGEWVRGNWLMTGFPWNLMAYVVNGSDVMLQTAALAGAYGVSFLVILSACLMAQCMNRQWIGPVFSCLLLAGMYGYGHQRLAVAEQGDKRGEPLNIRIVQPNIEQHHKWDPQLRFEAVTRHVKLTQSQPMGGLDLVIWSETAIPFFLNEQFTLMELVKEAVPEDGLLLSGALRAEPVFGEDGTLTGEKLYNSLFALTGDGEIIAYYDKRHLVPFGEYIPLRSLLPLEKITHGAQDFSKGTSPAVMRAVWEGEDAPHSIEPFRPLICYEAIFPEEIILPQMTEPGGTKPAWLLNITNDAWFGISTGPYQHFEAARMRAVETGLPLVRVANTGISGVVDAHGRVVSKIPLGVSAIADSRIYPVNLYK